MTQGHRLVCLNTGDATLRAKFHIHEDTTPEITFATSDISRSSQWHTSTDTYFRDHRIIKTTLNFKVTNNSTQPRWNLKEADWSGFTDYMEAHNNIRNIHRFTSVLLSAAHKYIPRSNPNYQKQNTVPWWNHTVANVIKERKRALNKYHKNKTQFNHNEYKKAKAHCRRTILQAKRESWADHVDQFNRFTSLSKIWSLVQSFNNNKQPLLKPITLKQNQNITTDPQEVVQTLVTHYHEQAATLPPSQ